MWLPGRSLSATHLYLSTKIRSAGGSESLCAVLSTVCEFLVVGLGGSREHREGILHGCLHGRARVAPLRLAQEAPGEERFVQEKDKCAAACGA